MQIATAALTLLLAAVGPHAPPKLPCSTQTLTIEATAVTVSYCLSGATRATGTQEIAVPVVESYASSSRSVRRSSELHFLAGEGISRIIESVDLTQLGLTGTLHLTLTYVDGVVEVEGALLTPGAITIK
jgi:hypothetical protein